MKIINKITLISMLFALLCGCTTTGKIDFNPEVMITENDMPDRKYRVLGDLDVAAGKITIFHKDPTKENVKNLLKKEAAKLGADAVILVRYGVVSFGKTSWGELKGKGRAVKFID